MIVLDASVLIAHLQTTDVHHDRATQLLIDVADEPLGASPLTLAQVFVGPAWAGKLDPARSAIRELAIVAVPLSEEAPARLASMRALTRLRLPDCCVLLAAETMNGSVATFDNRLAAAASELGLIVHD